MNRSDLENKSFDELIYQLHEEGFGYIESYDSLKNYATFLINNDCLMLAIHILNTLFDNDADWYIYDSSMGTLETPTPLTTKEDLVDYIED